jgi:hypothetical protein
VYPYPNVGPRDNQACQHTIYTAWVNKVCVYAPCCQSGGTELLVFVFGAIWKGVPEMGQA